MPDAILGALNELIPVVLTIVIEEETEALIDHSNCLSSAG